MITVSDTTRAILDGGPVIAYRVSVQSWLGDQLLADNIPVITGVEDTDRSLRVPERVTLTVPRRAAGVDWAPSADDSPLAAKGQTLKILLGVGKGADGIEWFQRGEFLIQETNEDDDGLTLTVTAVGLLALLDEAKFMAPFQPSGTFGSTVRSLAEPAVTVDLGDAPADRAYTTVTTFDSDRLQSLYDTLDLWPAVPRMHEQGYLQVLPEIIPTAAQVVKAFSALDGGTVEQITGGSTRDGAFSAVVVTGYTSDGTEVRGIRYVPTGPWAYPSGAANPLPVPFMASWSGAISKAIAGAVANLILNRKMREGPRRAWTVTAVIDPTIQIGDVVTITDADLDAQLCTVEALTLPYTPDGPMTLKVVDAT